MITIAVSHSQGNPEDILWHLNIWAHELITYARLRGYNVVDITGPDLTFHRFTEIMQRVRHAVLFNFSLGSRSFLIGNDERCFLTSGREDRFGICRYPSNLKAIQGTAIISYSSHSATRLGTYAVRQGTPLYIGWNDDLILVSDTFDTLNMFKDLLMPISYHMLDGWTAGMAVEQAQKDMLETIKKHKDHELVSLPLFHNRKHLTLLGNADWKVDNA